MVKPDPNYIGLPNLIPDDIYVIPDVLCNAGGVTVSYYEQVQNASNYFWSKDEVHQKLHERMKKAFQDVHQKATSEGISNRLAAFVIAVERIYEAMSLRG